MRNDYGSISEPLDSISIDDLCKNFNVDGILVLENFSEKVSRRIHTGQFAQYKGIIDLKYNSVWRFYQLLPNPSYLSFVVSDDIFWESPGYFYSLKEMYKKLPTIKDALIGGGLALGLDLANQFNPKWIEAT